jgi:DNA processing protein
MENGMLYKIALTFVPNIGPVLAKNLISYCGGVEAIFKEKKKALSKIPGIGESRANDILEANVFNRAEQELSFILKNKVKTLFFLDEDYPKRMKNFDYCPILLYYKGSSDLNHNRTVALVGSNSSPTMY